MKPGELLSKHWIYQGRVVKLSLDEVRLPNGNVAQIELVSHPGASAVVPLDAAGQVLLVRQYRHAAQGWLLEVPAGKLDAGESPEACARREVEEETGHKASRLESMGWIWTTPGFSDERIWLYLATGLEPSLQNLQQDEVLTVERLDLGQAIEMAETGTIQDAKSVCALLRASRLVRR